MSPLDKFVSINHNWTTNRARMEISIISMPNLHFREVISISERQNRTHQNQERQPNRCFRGKSRLLPFAQRPADNYAEQYQHNHMDGPTGEFVITHANMSEIVEEELPIPKAASQHSLADIEAELNERPRKCLGFRSPNNLKHKLAA